MNETVIPASPNWYCSKVIDCNNKGDLVFGSRHDVYYFDSVEFPPKFKGVFVGHREKVTALSLSCHEQYYNLCCSATEGGDVKLWQMDSRSVQGEHTIHSCKVTTVCWSLVQPDLVVTGDENGTIGVWQFEDNRQSAHRPDKGAIYCMAASPSNASIVAVGYKTGQIALVDVKRGATIVSRLRGHDEEIHCLAWCPIPGETFKTSDSGGSNDITDLESFGVEDSWRKKPKSPKPNEGFGTEGWLLASGSRDKTVRIWSTSKGRQLLQMKLPHPARRERTDDGNKSRVWLTLCWPKGTPQQIVSSSQSGDLLQWDITKTGKDKCQCLHSQGRGHTRSVFNISQLPNQTNIICTFSMDRQIMFWDMDLKHQTGVLPSLGGYVYAAKASPLDPGQIALGVGDSMIRLWNLNASPDGFDWSTLWQGIRSKVTALNWHPKREGLLAYGTDDGRVGIYDTLSNKPPSISTTYHRRTVYAVTWGPPSSYYTEKESVSQGYHVYSCGDGNILEHNINKLGNEAQSINKLIQSTNPDYRYQTRVPTRSEICWTPDFTAVAVGNDDGTVEIYRPPDFTLIATIQVHHKLVNSIQWHPDVTMATPTGSQCKHWLAVGSNEFHVAVVDLSKVFDRMDITEPLHITECLKKLEGHSNRVTSLVWSPHTEGQLVSVSYDGNAIVWNVQDGAILACYHGHLGKLLCVFWNGLDSDEIVTGGDDFSIHRWKISKNPVQPGHLDVKKKKKKKANKSKSEQPAALTTTVDNLEATFVTIATEDQEDIEALLEQKKQELMANEGIVVKEIDVGCEIPVNEASHQLCEVEMSVPTEKGDNTGTKVEKQDLTSAKDKKKKKAKSMFPELGRKENRGKQYVLDDIITLAKLIYEEDNSAVLGEDITHLGLFLNRRSTYSCLHVEGEYHRNNDNMDYFYQLELWKGNINGVLRVARQRDELSDWLVAMAPMASYDTWTSVCEDYAHQLETDGQYHKSASYFLACHKVYEAIKVFKRHKLFKEAIALAKVRLSPLDPVLEELYTLWAQQLTKDGNYEQAAKCHLAMKQVQDAAKLLARRYDQSSLRTAAHISMIANDKQQGLMYSQRIVQQHLLQHEWPATYKFLHQQKDLQVFLATSSIHEMLNYELNNLGILTIDKSCFSKWDQKNTQKIILPDFILDPGDMDNLSPWQPHLIDGHTFPHYILRKWYSHLDISMDTTSLENMYKTLCLLHAGRQSQVEFYQVLIQVCTDLTLCMFSLMMSETPTAMSHLLQAVGSLHEAGHLQVLQGLLRLFLPQGPKYILKLQQEVTAMRVMISMDTHTHVDGASKVHTIKRYLSDHKDDNVVNTSSLRCRELDCLRAYYYVALLNFLQESCNSGEVTLNAETVGDKKSGTVEGSADLDNEISNNQNSDSVSVVETSVEARLDENGNAENANDEDAENGNMSESGLASNSDRPELTRVDSGDRKGDTGTDNIKTEPIVQSLDTRDTSKSITNVQSSLDTDISGTTSALEDKEGRAINTKQTKSQTIPVFNVNHYSITMSQLSKLSQGLLWDLQAKRFALTETLGYIHKAISQLILSKNAKTADKNELVASETSSLGNIPEQEQLMAPGHTECGVETGVSSVMHHVKSDPELMGHLECDHKAQKEGAVSMATQISPEASAKNANDPIPIERQMSGCDHEHMMLHEGHAEGHICHSMLSHHFDHILNVHAPQTGNAELPIPVIESETEFKCSFFEVCSSCELLQKSRKILFEDEPHFHTRQESGLKNVTNVTNPAKYINVPDEWYPMPVDEKYFKSYVTMAILKDEQEYVMHELKRGPDSTQSPFPNPLECVKPLMDVGQHSSRISNIEHKEFVQKIITWALNFSVTTQQKQAYISLLQSHLQS